MARRGRRPRLPRKRSAWGREDCGNRPHAITGQCAVCCWKVSGGIVQTPVFQASKLLLHLATSRRVGQGASMAASRAAGAPAYQSGPVLWRSACRPVRGDIPAAHSRTIATDSGARCHRRCPPRVLQRLACPAAWRRCGRASRPGSGRRGYAFCGVVEIQIDRSTPTGDEWIAVEYSEALFSPSVVEYSEELVGIVTSEEGDPNRTAARLRITPGANGRVVVEPCEQVNKIRSYSGFIRGDQTVCRRYCHKAARRICLRWS